MYEYSMLFINWRVLLQLIDRFTPPGPGKFSMSSILGTSSSSAPSTPLLKAALTSAPLGPLAPSPAVTSTTAPAAAAEASVSSEVAPSGNLEIDIDEDYDA